MSSLRDPRAYGQKSVGGPVVVPTQSEPQLNLPPDGSSLRDQIATHVRERFRVRPGPIASQMVLAGTSFLLSGTEADDIADLAMAVVRDVLAAKNTEIERLSVDLAEMQTIATERSEACGRAEVERDRLRTAAEHTDELLSSIALYISWRYVTKQLTTPQKELFADALERAEMRTHGPVGDDPDPEMARLPSYAPRWWRDAPVDQPTQQGDDR